MATKTITLEIDAYERLKRAKANEKESFSSVVRRAEFPAVPGTGAAILEFLRKEKDLIPSEDQITQLTRNRLENYRRPRMSANAWEVAE